MSNSGGVSLSRVAPILLILVLFAGLAGTAKASRNRSNVKISHNDLSAWVCIHNHEGAWNDNTGNGYWGGLQMDSQFMSDYGPEYLRRYGTADKWPSWIQIKVGRRARDGWYNPYNKTQYYARGYHPWGTAGLCGLI